MVIGFNPLDGSANLFNDACSFMAQHHRPHCHATLATDHVIIGAAQTYCGEAHQYFRGTWRIERNTLDRQRLANFAKYGGKCIHNL